MSDIVLGTRGLAAGYNGQPVIHDVDLSFTAGEMVGLFGANGAGKTTTLLALAGEIAPLRGEVQLFGRSHPGSLYRAARAGVALLTDDRAIFAPLTARDNLRLGRGSVERALGFFPELEEHLDRRAGLLSGGQQQMLSLARILAAEPRVILADELSLGLAPLIVRRLLIALREAADRGTAVVLVEQHVAVAARSIDRAFVLAHGRIALELSGEQLRADPSRVAEVYLAG
jgi:ABC-type branched-subunit amino acid transport system ATPase component